MQNILISLVYLLILLVLVSVQNNQKYQLNSNRNTLFTLKTIENTRITE